MKAGTIEYGQGHTTFAGEAAVTLYSLTALIVGLRAEHRAPPGFRLTRGPSMLARAKRVTGLRTNDREAHIARLEILRDQARAQCVVVDHGEAT